MIKSAKGIIVINGNYLLQLRDNKKNIYFPNFWCLFGGQLDAKETYLSALRREIKEETNLIVKKSRKIFSIKYNMIGIKKKRSMIYFECKVDKKNKIILGEGQRFKCFPFNKIKKLKIVPMDYVAIHSHYYNSRNYTSFYR
tara:strand:- start:847 stop:1269 length:423 start_codon:yes stop_codon:yes gene_type:complete